MDNLKPLKLNSGGQGNIVQYVLLGLLAFAIVLGFSGLFWWNKPGNSPSVVNLVLGRGSLLEEEDGRVNVLLLGIAGEGHNGPNLTDTIIVASYNTKNSQIDLISLPRDLWLDSHKAKINTLYQLGLNQDRGLDFAREEIGKILGIKIPYAVRMDFNGFVKAVDLVEGIDVNVENSFDDYFYPVPGKEKELCEYKEEEKDISEEESKILGVEPGRLKVLLDKEGKVAAAAKPGESIVYSDTQVFKLFPCRFEYLSFVEGQTPMDGATALKYVRSRHGTNKEGTDFARSKRQQKVLQAFKDKILSTETLFDLPKIVDLVKTLDKSIETNIESKQYLEFGKLVKKQRGIKSHVIDNSSGKDPLLVAPPPGQYESWVLIPANNDFGRLQKYVSDIFLSNLESSQSASQN